MRDDAPRGEHRRGQLRTPIRLVGIAVVLVTAGTACGALQPDASWLDQLEPDAPCYRVDLVDGLDEQSTAEVHDLFACLDHFGHLAAFRAVDEALDVETRTGVPSGIETAIVANRLADADIDPFAAAEIALDLLASDTEALTPWLDVFLELGWGGPADDIRAGGISLDDPAATQRGVWLPLAPVVGIAATSLLDDDLEAAAFVGGILEDPDTQRWVHSTAAAFDASDGASAFPEDLLVHLGQGIAASRSPDNDRWPGASGDSLRDLVDFFVVQDNPVVDQIAPQAEAILSDPLVRQEIPPALAALDASGDLDRLLPDLTWLASVDVDGNPLQPGEVSALYRFGRLLSDNNRPIDCTISIFGFPLFEWSFPNLAVATLELMAGLSPGSAQDLAGLLSDLTGSAITEELLDLAVDAQVCPDFTAQTLDDLQALEAVSQPEATGVLAGLVSALAVLQDGTTDHLPDLADLAEALFLAGSLEPVEEVLRDLGEAPVAEDLVQILVLSLDPASHGVDVEAPVDLFDVVTVASWALSVDPTTDRTGFQRIRPWMAPILAEDATWQAIGNLGALFADNRTQTSRLGTLLPPLLDLDPDLTLLGQLGPLLSDEAIARPLLRILETDQVMTEWTTPPVSGGPATPLTFVGAQLVDDTVEDLLRLINTVVAGL